MLHIQNLSFFYEKSRPILSDINLHVKKGDTVSILGESGSGKSTLLRLIYGLEGAASGTIIYANKLVTGPRYNLVPGHEKMKFVPQEFDLLNPVSVSENIGKYLSNFDIPQKKQSIEKTLHLVGLSAYKDDKPSELSGGQRQRVAIARALAVEPEFLLLDEPFSHLDQALKFQLRKRIWDWAKETGTTVILTTHDSSDALGFSDQLILMKEGKIVQEGLPINVRENPANMYVASLLGIYNLLNHNDLDNFFRILIPSNKKGLIYPEEIYQDETGVEFKLIDVRFQGRDYLIEAKRGETKLVFYADQKPEKDWVRLQIKKFRLVDDSFEI